MQQQIPSVQTVSVPKNLKGAKYAAIRLWAREILMGQEAKLSNDELAQIRQGKLKEITLRPKKDGFFAPDHTFVETHTVETGDDVKSVIETSKKLRSWIDEENSRFNKKSKDSKKTQIFEFWQHGKRMDEYATETKTNIREIVKELSLRATTDQSAYQGDKSHTIAYKLYKWRPNAQDDDPVFGWSWTMIDSLFSFTHNEDVMNYVETLFDQRLIPNGVRLGDLAFFLRSPSPKKTKLWHGNRDDLKKIRILILNGQKLDQPQIDTLITELKKTYE